jgi:hypothetical protein
VKKIIATAKMSCEAKLKEIPVSEHLEIWACISSDARRLARGVDCLKKNDVGRGSLRR